MLRDKEQSQNVLTREKSHVLSYPTEICNVVAVTAEKKVAIVDILRTPSDHRFCSYRIAGNPGLSSEFEEFILIDRNYRIC